MGYHVFVSPSFTWDIGNIFPLVASSFGVDHVFVSVYISWVITSSCRFTFHGLSRPRVGLHFMGYHVFVSPSFTWDSGNIFPPVPKFLK